MFTWARTNLDSACNSVVQFIDFSTVGRYDSASLQVKGPSQLTNAHHVGKNFNGLDLQSLLDALPSSASYLVDKVRLKPEAVFYIL